MRVQGEDKVTLRLAIQTGLLTNIPSSVRVISVNLEAEQIKMIAIFERTPTDREKETLLDAGLDAAGQFSRHISVDVQCVVDDRPLVMLMRQSHDPSYGYMVYARYEEDYG